MDRSEARALLGVDRAATAADHDEAFRRLALANHPDTGGDPEHFRRLVRARAVLRGEPVVRPAARPAPVVVVPDAPLRHQLLEALGRRPARPSRTRRVR